MGVSLAIRIASTGKGLKAQTSWQRSVKWPQSSSSGNGKLQVMLHGNAKPTFKGISFNGNNDYASIKGFAYAQNATFTVSFWMTKQECTKGAYEYLYSHHNSVDKKTMYTNAFLNIYLACESSGSGGSSAKGSIIRYNLFEGNSQSRKESMFDYPLHSAGDFDSVTNTWVHVILAVTPTSCVTYDDGTKVKDSAYAFFAKKKTATTNNAYKTPGWLTNKMQGLNLAGDIYLGTRADLHSDRHFNGYMALLTVLDDAISPAAAMCLFRSGDTVLPDPHAIYKHSGVWQWGLCLRDCGRVGVCV